MAHSHDRTFLASLAFGDPDKRDRMHDLACEYLSQPTQGERLIVLTNAHIEGLGIYGSSSRIESAISKGEGQYRTTIGFLDVRVDWAGLDNKNDIEVDGAVFVEVKIAPISMGDVLRQFSLYREYLTDSALSAAVANESAPRRSKKKPIFSSTWVLATAFDLSAGDTDILRQANVHPIRLSDGFTKWFEERQKREAPKLEQF